MDYKFGAFNEKPWNNGCKISDMDLIQILQNSPEEYESVLELFKYELEEELYDIKRLKFELQAK